MESHAELLVIVRDVINRGENTPRFVLVIAMHPTDRIPKHALALDEDAQSGILALLHQPSEFRVCRPAGKALVFRDHAGKRDERESVPTGPDLLPDMGIPADAVPGFGFDEIPSHNQPFPDLTEKRRFSHNVVIQHGIITWHGFFDRDWDHVFTPAIGAAPDYKYALDFGIAFHFL